jgi:hypothetical protein
LRSNGSKKRSFPEVGYEKYRDDCFMNFD